MERLLNHIERGPCWWFHVVKYYGSKAFQENSILKVWKSIICECLVYKIPTILSKLYIYRADEGFAFLCLEFSAGHDGCLGY